MKLDKVSRLLSLVLRHDPVKIGLVLDANGWADVDQLLRQLALRKMPITRDDLQTIVDTNDKKRFAFNPEGTKLRASQGHSVSVELGIAASVPPNTLYHGTATKFLVPIRKEGLIKRTRQHVHLSEHADTAAKVGSRHGRSVVFWVDAKAMQEAGHAFFCSENGVWLTDHVPAQYLKLI